IIFTSTLKERKSMNLRNVSGYLPVILLLFILVIPSDVLCVEEDTAYLSFKKTPISKNRLYQYIVKKGDIVSNIIQTQLKANDNDIYKILSVVKQLNPEIKDINRIYPGQKLILPGKDVLKTTMKGDASVTGKETAHVDAKKVETVPPIPAKSHLPAIDKEASRIDTKKDAIPSMPAKKYLPVIRHMINRLDGSVITDGTYYIPIPPTGQIIINCSMVPIVELDDGSRVLLDFSSQIPNDVKKMIESTWRNYSVVNDDIGVFSALKKVIDTSKTHSIKRFGEYAKVGETPMIKILLDWLVSEKITSGRKPHLHGLNLVGDSSRLLPRPIKKYAEKNGLTITEVIANSGVASATDENYPLTDLPTINSSTNRELAVSLLTTLGYTPTKNTEVKVFNSTKDGFNLSVKADLLIRSEGKCVIINFKKMPEQFINIFKKRGTKIIFISEREQKKEVVQKVLYAMDIPFSAGNFEFLIPEKADNPRAIIYLHAIKVRIDKNTTYHFADFDVDDEINGLLHKKWGVNLIKY
ncbi:MAG: hypothetical protein Q7J27_04475, partial [Syntrophales bacterium]|nr:hypothetical protein [Syntrophales bacterium]